MIPSNETGSMSLDLSVLKPGAYVTDDTKLWEVRAVNGPGSYDRVELENASDGYRRSWLAHQIKCNMTLVREAPVVPDQPPERTL